MNNTDSKVIGNVLSQCNVADKEEKSSPTAVTRPLKAVRPPESDKPGSYSYRPMSEEQVFKKKEDKS